jgi:hypothetical protein
MGYDLHVTRKEYWCDETGPEISLDEWIRYVRSDGEVQPDPDNPGDENWIVVLGVDSWPLWWSTTGEVYTKNPEDAMTQKLISIASVLNARVLGDDEEIYSTDSSGAISIERR